MIRGNDFHDASTIPEQRSGAIDVPPSARIRREFTKSEFDSA
jgi:hypothetical protein